MVTTILIVLIITGIYLFWYFNRQSKFRREVVNYSIEQAKEKINTVNNILLLDVRSHMERRSKKINDSIHIPLHELKHSIENLKEHINKEIICYCHSGVRSLSAAYILKHHGFKSANLNGGIVAWLAYEKNN